MNNKMLNTINEEIHSLTLEKAMSNDEFTRHIINYKISILCDLRVKLQKLIIEELYEKIESMKEEIQK